MNNLKYTYILFLPIDSYDKNELKTYKEAWSEINIDLYVVLLNNSKKQHNIDECINLILTTGEKSISYYMNYLPLIFPACIDINDCDTIVIVATYPFIPNSISYWDCIPDNRISLIDTYIDKIKMTVMTGPAYLWRVIFSQHTSKAVCDFIENTPFIDNILNKAFKCKYVIKNNGIYDISKHVSSYIKYSDDRFHIILYENNQYKTIYDKYLESKKIKIYYIKQSHDMAVEMYNYMQEHKGYFIFIPDRLEPSDMIYMIFDYVKKYLNDTWITCCDVIIASDICETNLLETKSMSEDGELHIPYNKLGCDIYECFNNWIL